MRTSIGGRLLPADRIQVRRRGGEVVPDWVGLEDHAWLRTLIGDFVRLDGRPLREAVSFLREPSRVPVPRGKRCMASWALQKMCTQETPPLDAALLRDHLSLEAQKARDRGRFDRSEAVTTVASRLGVAPDEIDKLLFADFPSERRLRIPDPLPDPHLLAIKTNLALAQGLLRLASEVNIHFHGCARAVVRQVRLRRLLCTMRRDGSEGVHLEVSGPLSLFRHTTMYGSALASILPLLPWCEHYELIAICMLRGAEVRVRICSNDPIGAGEAPRTFDSRLEERFARDFARANLDWDLVREPEPIEASGVLVFPDFAVVNRRNPSIRFLLEIVGFWTPDYLKEKLIRLRALPQNRLVLCIDRGLNCGMEDLPVHARVIWFHRRIDPLEVLEVIAQETQESTESGKPGCARNVERLNLNDLFIDWAGRYASSDPVHRRIERLEPGTEVRFREDGPRIVIEAGNGLVAVLSRRGHARWALRLDRILSAKVIGVIERHAEQSSPGWRSRLQCDCWKVPIVEAVLEGPPEEISDGFQSSQKYGS